MAFSSSFFVQGHNTPKENIAYYTIFGDLAQERYDRRNSSWQIMTAKP
jgi:hypothetical protein